MTIQLSKRALRAAIIFSADEDFRHYLNGVKVETTKTHTKMIATDGHRIIAVRHKADNKRKMEMTVPIGVCKEASKGKASEDILIDIKGKNTLIQTQLGMLHFNPIEGKFIDWRNVMSGYKTPEIRENKPLAINGKYLNDCSRAAKHLGSPLGGLVLCTSESMDAVVRVISDTSSDYEIEMFVMPMNSETIAKEKELPTWIAK